MSRLALTIPLVVLVPIATSLQPLARAEPAASRIVDRTVVCSVAKRAGIRQVEVHARSGTRHIEDRTTWKFLASTSVSEGFFSPSLGWVAAGWPPYLEPGQKPSNVTLSIVRRCAPTSARVPLTKEGLSGFAASPLDDEYHCAVPTRVLVRVTAEYRAPTSLRPNRKWNSLTARGIVRQATLAVRTDKGKPVSLATVNESGKARLYVANHCKPDLIQSDG